MLQLLQDLSKGDTRLAELPVPGVRRGGVLIRTRASLISAGTERMLLDFGRAGWIEKARQQPEKVREVLHKVRNDGLAPTLEAVRSKLDQPMPLGYCNVGIVESVSDGVTAFKPGDRVASNGPHAEFVSVPVNLCAAVPPSVTDEEAAFTVIGAIALQGVRLARPTIGECFVVTGLGLVGLMTVQILRANGCRVLGIDTDPEKTKVAGGFGAETVTLADGQDPLEAAASFSRHRGVDGVLLTLSTTSSDPVSQAARMCRKRGRLVLVGVSGLELNRSEFYEKELTFQVSCSYGPGRYDPAYEQGGQDYPLAHVRWTEQRNFEAVLDLMASGALDVKPLITHRFRFSEATAAYDLLARQDESYLGITLEYDDEHADPSRTIPLNAPDSPPEPTGRGSHDHAGVSCGFLGAGNYAGRVLIPAFRRSGATLRMLANSGGPLGTHYGRKYGFGQVTTDSGAVVNSADVDAVVIATRHDSHAGYVLEALQAGKHVFCEKPLALTTEEVDRLQSLYESLDSRPVLTVGFNRRFAPQVQTMRRLIARIDEPKSLVMNVNAGRIPPDHWTQDPQVGGGRIVGEACHFIDLLRCLVDQPIVSTHVVSMARSSRVAVADENAIITLEFADGSVGSVNYLANGHKALPKERLEVFCAGRVLQLDNFRVLRGFGWSERVAHRQWRQDKGQTGCAGAFLNAVSNGGPNPIPVDELFEVSRVSIEAAERARGG